MALLMAGGFTIWQSLSSDPLREALLANVSPLPTPLAAKSIDELKQQISDAALGRLTEPVLQASGSQLEQLAILPPLWAQIRGDALLSQAQQLWPASQDVKRLSTLWQQQRGWSRPAGGVKTLCLGTRAFAPTGRPTEWIG